MNLKMPCIKDEPMTQARREIDQTGDSARGV